MSTPIRYRTDSLGAAEAHARARRGEAIYTCQCDDPTCVYHPAVYEKVPVAQAGDAWRINWYEPEGNGLLAGFAICCPKCGLVHYWTSANNCASKRKTESGSIICDHTGKASCWSWTLDESGRPITARASLFANGDGHCGYHGWLNQDGNSPGILSDG